MPLNFRHQPLRPLLLICLAALLCLASWAVAAEPAGGQGAPAETDLYAADPSPLTPSQCGQCHTRHFGDLKANGGRHRFDCLNCHQVIHAYNPVRGNYADLMPKCSACHSAPHGEKHVKCLACHDNPHAPAVAPALALVQDVCADCHGNPAKELKDRPSKHSQQKCQSCHHDRHGYIPSCGECHSPHYPDQPLAGCTSCHPVHRPRDIAFTPEVKPQVCQQCHGQVVTKWTATASRHGQVACISCHTRHGLIPACQDCHGTPHDARQLAMFPRCLDCHLDVHDLPVKKK